MGYVSGVDYERILAIVAEASHGTPDEPLSSAVLEMIRAFVRCDSAAYFDGAPWDLRDRRIWTTPIAVPWTDDQKAIVRSHRFDLPLYPSPRTIGRAVRISDVMGQLRHRGLAIYQLAGRAHGIEYAMDYWTTSPGGRSCGLRFDSAGHDFSDRTRDAVEVLGRHLRTVVARYEAPRTGRSTERLTAREAEILGLVAGGRTNRDIGRALSISPHTVRKHLENAYLRLGVRSRAEAVAWTYGARKT